MRTQVHVRLSDLLDRMEDELRQTGLWEDSPPSAEALASVQPFAVDTLAFNQWLQFVFVARLRIMAVSGAELPQSCSVQPMAEEALKGLACDISDLLNVVGEVDRLLSGPGGVH